MSRFERLLIPIIAAVAVAAFFLEDLSAASVRRVGLVFGGVLAAVLIVGMIHRARRKRRAAGRADQTSNEPQAGGPSG